MANLSDDEANLLADANVELLASARDVVGSWGTVDSKLRRLQSAVDHLEQIVLSLPLNPCYHYRRGPIRYDDSQECLDCGIVIVSDG